MVRRIERTKWCEIGNRIWVPVLRESARRGVVVVGAKIRVWETDANLRRANRVQRVEAKGGIAISVVGMTIAAGTIDSIVGVIQVAGSRLKCYANGIAQSRGHDYRRRHRGRCPAE